ncbi:YkoF family thiamine/hydroxymethylpyrimidine-binding protein [Roseovarius sp. SYSU LYC5161]|uniref:YkoF family thiamine/hydroxymethylpyrimidine-binding protein n=1 Tax=Roseovarius halophilus (ex Wu et al. 2025) TaxID=3376060 RepID=UPI00399A4276
MFIGAQVSLYPMTSDFVEVITAGLDALTPYKEDLRIDTDDMSTLMVGAPEPLIDGLRDLFAASVRRPENVTMHVTLSRGCPGEPDDPSCRCEVLDSAQDTPLDERKSLALKAVSNAPDLGVDIDLQFSIYVLGTGDHMDEIYGCIDFLKESGAEVPLDL